MTQGFRETSVKSQKNSKFSSLKSAIDCEQLHQQLAEHFENLEDPRGSQGVLHPFISTIDAMGTQHEIAHRIVTLGADYVLALKANHPTLHTQVKQWFENAQESDFEGVKYSYDVRVESGHHRCEKRQVTAVSIQQMGSLYKQAQWSGLQTIVRVVRTRHLWNKTTQEVMFYLSSLPANAQLLGKAIRQHWSIENQLHWVLDVTFGEDACRIRTGHAPENIALLKRWSINLLNQETSFKRSIRHKGLARM